VVCSYRRREFGGLLRPPQATSPVQIDKRFVRSQAGWTCTLGAILAFRNRAEWSHSRSVDRIAITSNIEP
jgi:hypothetical protein